MEINAFLLPGKAAAPRRPEDGDPVMVRPFINARTGAETGQVVSFPGAFSGSVTVTSGTQLWGSDVNGLLVLLANCHASLDALAGFRYVDLAEDLHHQPDLVPVPGRRHLPEWDAVRDTQPGRGVR